MTTPTAVSRWTSGTYTHDGAGNVKAIGTHTFTYDKMSRLTAANLYLEPTASPIVGGLPGGAIRRQGEG